MTTEIDYAPAPPEPTRAEWKRIALLHLDSAMWDRCLVHPECASSASFGVGAADEGLACFRLRTKTFGLALTAEDRWLLGLECRLCQRRFKDHRARRRSLEMVKPEIGGWHAFAEMDSTARTWQRVSNQRDMHPGPESYALLPKSPIAWVHEVLASRNSDAHHFCPRSQKPHEAPEPWRSRLFGEVSTHAVNHFDTSATIAGIMLDETTGGRR